MIILNKTIITTILCLLLLASSPFLFPQAPDQETGDQEKIVEHVEVVNVEVVVRAYLKNKPEPVGGLKKEDFKLIVDGKEKDIHAFYEIRKKIAPIPGSKPAEPAEPSKPSEARLFALVFNVHAWTEEMNKHLDTLFQTVIRPGDRVMAIFNHSLLNETVVRDGMEMKEKIREYLEKESARMKRTMRQLEIDFNEVISIVASHPGRDLDYYRDPKTEQLKREFSRNYFNPAVKDYSAIARYLGTKKGRKWVLVFYQMGMMPTYGAKLEEVRSGLAKNIARDFINTGATVHTLLMHAPTVTGNVPKSFGYKPYVLHSETIFRDISQLTGGKVIRADDVGKFVKKISGKEDIHYVLTFDPGKLKGKPLNVEVQLRDSRLRLAYDNGRRSGDYLEQVGETVSAAPSELDVIFSDNRARDLVREGQFRDALEYFSRSIRYNPENALVYYNRGLTYYKLSEWDHALADYTAALELNPQYTDAFYNRGLTYMQKKEYQNAVSDFNRVLQLDPAYGPVYGSRAQALENTGKFQEALKDYKMIETRAPLFYSKYKKDIDDKINELGPLVEAVSPKDAGLSQPNPKGYENLEASIDDYDTLIRDINYKWTREDSEKRLRLIKARDALPKTEEELKRQTRLDKILKKSARYCKKLEQSAFHFFCKERVSEWTDYISGYPYPSAKQKHQNRKLVYDYRILWDKKEMKEDRKLVKSDKVPFEHIKTMQGRINRPAIFKHRYLIFGPVSMLGEQWQSSYRYRLVGEETTREGKIAVIEALPLELREPALHFGKIHINEADGSVVKIEWNPKSMQNFDFLHSYKERFNISPRASFVIDFSVVKKGIRFPGKCHISWGIDKVNREFRLGHRGKIAVITGATSDITYKNYNFFSVETEVTHVETD